MTCTGLASRYRTLDQRSVTRFLQFGDGARGLRSGCRRCAGDQRRDRKTCTKYLGLHDLNSLQKLLLARAAGQRDKPPHPAEVAVHQTGIAATDYKRSANSKF